MKEACAFTLIELLVVIAIIAILAALLFPALSRAKNQSAKAADLNNFREILAALHIYTGDNHDSLTWPNWDYGGAMPDGTARAGWLYTPNLSATGTNIFNGQAGLLWDSLHGGKILLCPMDLPEVAVDSEHYGGVAERPQQLSSYIMNGAVSGFQSGYLANEQAVKISLMQPGDGVLWEGDEREPFCFNDGSNWPLEGISTRHLNGSMLALLDGSSCYVRWTDWQNEVAQPYRNRWWCYPNTPDGGDSDTGHNY